MNQHELETHLKQSRRRHHLLKHPFFRAVSSTELSTDQVARILGQWWHPLHYFPTFLAKLIAVVPSVEMKTAISSILHEELGEGDAALAHERIYIQTMTDVGFSRAAVSETAMTPATARLLARYGQSTDDTDVGLGFLYGTEVADLAMVSGIGVAVRRVTGVHTLPWVDIHVAQEPGHIDRAGSAVAYSQEQLSVILGAANEMWDLWTAFFDELELGVFGKNNPRVEVSDSGAGAPL